MGENSNFDMLVLKYNPAGKEIWSARYDGPASGEDLISALAVGRDGSVYLTGQCRVPDARNDFTTLKFNPDGTLAWMFSVASENQALHAYGRDLVIDSAGNVYVTGDNTLPSMMTIKLNPDGGAEWSQSIAGFKHLQARAIAIDSSGNVIVTGYADREDYNPDFLTVKYNSSGAEQWIAWHGGAYGDMPADVVVDRAGNIYLSGTDSDSVYLSDYIALKYNADAVLQWTDRFDVETTDYINATIAAAKKIALDATGNVFVAVENPGRFILIKYDSPGNPIWQVETDSLHYWRELREIRLADDGSVYLAGSMDNALGLMKISCAGELLWTATAKSADFLIDLEVDRNSAIITGTTSGVYNKTITVKYNSSGQKEWNQIFNSASGNYEFPCDLAVDFFGNIYAAGYSWNDAVNNSSRSAYLIKYTHTGEVAWIKSNETGFEWMTPSGVAVDQIGNVVFNLQNIRGITTIKYHPSRREIWQAHNPLQLGHLYPMTQNIRIDEMNFIYIFLDNAGILKYHPDGQPEWVIESGNGIYISVFRVNDFTERKKIVLVK